MATRSELFSYLTWRHTTTFILLRIFFLIGTISLKIWERPLSWHEKCSLPVSVRASKRSLAKALYYIATSTTWGERKICGVDCRWGDWCYTRHHTQPQSCSLSFVSLDLRTRLRPPQIAFVVKNKDGGTSSTIEHEYRELRMTTQKAQFLGFPEKQDRGSRKEKPCFFSFDLKR